MQEDKNIRLKYIDFAKGLGIIMVVAAHLINQGGMKFHLSDFISDFIYQFHMPAFFVISGFTVGLSIEKYGKLPFKKILKRSGRLFAGYILWSLIYIYLSKLTYEGFDCKEQFTAMVTFRGRAPIWFLAALAFAEMGYGVIHCILSIIKNERLKKFIIPALILIFVFLVILLQGIDISGFALWQQYLWITVTRFFPSLFFIAFGSFLYKLFKKFCSGFKLIIISLIMMIAVFILTLIFRNSVNMHLAEFGNLLIFFVNALLGSVSLIAFSKGICELVNSHIIQELGKNSLGIMVFHYPPYFLVFSYSQAICRFFGIEGAFVSYVFCLCLSLGFTYLLTKLIKIQKLFL